MPGFRLGQHTIPCIIPYHLGGSTLGEGGITPKWNNLNPISFSNPFPSHSSVLPLTPFTPTPKPDFSQFNTPPPLLISHSISTLEPPFPLSWMAIPTTEAEPIPPFSPSRYHPLPPFSLVCDLCEFLTTFPYRLPPHFSILALSIPVPAPSSYSFSPVPFPLPIYPNIHV